MTYPLHVTVANDVNGANVANEANVNPKVDKPKIANARSSGEFKTASRPSNPSGRLGLICCGFVKELVLELMWGHSREGQIPSKFVDSSCIKCSVFVVG